MVWSVNKECMLFLLDSTLTNSSGIHLLIVVPNFVNLITFLPPYISLNRSVKSVTKSRVISDKVQQLHDYVILCWYYC